MMELPETAVAPIMESGSPVISVVIPTCHRDDLLSKCLDRLRPSSQTLPYGQYEVVVTDDGVISTAERLVRERYAWAKWVAGPRRGPAANRNNGARVSLGHWLIFVDDDCVPEAGWLSSFSSAAIANPSTHVFEGMVYADRDRRSLSEKCPSNESGGYLWSCNVCIQKELFWSMNGFDERYPFAGMEDVDFKLRLTQAGKHFIFVRDASVCHPWREGKGWIEHWRYQQSVYIYLSLHPDESKSINVRYYLTLAFKKLFRDIPLGTFRYCGRGLPGALLEAASYLQMVLKLIFRPPRGVRWRSAVFG